MSDTNLHPDELLPWYVNNTLDSAEREQVEQHLKTCASCQQEVELLRAVQQHVKQSQRTESPGELGLRRLLRDVKQAQRKPHAWLPVALAASLVVIVMQATVLVTMLSTTDQAIAPLGEQTQTDRAQLQVRFVATASELEIRTVLNEVDGVIISGPGALGVYHVRLATIRANQTAQIETALQRLRAHTQVVHYVAAE